MKNKSRYSWLTLPATLTVILLGMAGVSWGATLRVATGDNHTMMLRSDGTIWATGENVSGQLGDGTTFSRNAWVQTGIDHDWVAVAAGSSHTLALKTDGSLWAWGSNQFGQLGDGFTANMKSPVRIGTSNDWVAVAADGSSSFALKGDGTLWAWGQNNMGQLGNGSAIDRNFPALVLNMNTVTTAPYVAVSAGDQHTMALQADGTLWTWGANSFGQIGRGPADPAVHSIPGQVGIDSAWIAISAGGLHSLAMKADGSLWGWGDNQFGQLAQSPVDLVPYAAPVQIGTDRDWAGISAGNLHTVAVKRNGTLWTWGENSSGQLGNGTLTQQNVPTQITEPSDVTDVVSAAAGMFHSVAVKANGEIFAWGDNGLGQLGSGSTAGYISPAPVNADVTDWVDVEPGGRFTVARRSNGTLWAWGDNARGQLGDDTLAQSLDPVLVGTSANWVAEATGWSHTVALKADGTLWSWGDNTSGQLGDGTHGNRHVPTQITMTQPVSASNNWKTIAAGDFHTLALKADGTLWAWGNNASGQLGIGFGGGKAVPVQVVTNNPGHFDRRWAAIAAGGSYSLALQTDGTLWAWGDNHLGQLGRNPSLGASIARPRQVVDLTSPVSGFNSSWVAVAAGLSHSLALQANGSLWAWGSDASGELGNGIAGPLSQFVPSQVLNPGTSPYVSVSAGDSFSVARAANGTLWSWGKNTSGQLGNGTSDPDQINPLPHPAPVQVNGNAGAWILAKNGGSHTVALKAAGTLDAWGNNGNGQLGDGTIVGKNAPHSFSEGHLAVVPATVDFGIVATGKVASRTISVNNISTAPLTVSGLILAGADKAMFTVTAASCGPLPFTIAAGGGCPIQATFNPAANAGSRSATLTATSNDPLNPSTTINFSATAKTPFTVIASTAGGSPAANGTISPSGAVKVLPGDRPVFTITPGTGYHITDVTVDGASKGAVASVTLPPVIANASITASFAINTYAISMSPGANGVITGPGVANHGTAPTYSITPNTGYHVADVKVDGASKGAVTSVTLPPVTGNVVMTASFAPNTYTITASSDSRGAMTPSGAATVNHGSSQTYTFLPNSGYFVVNVIVDGVSQGAPSSYTFNTVTGEGHSIKVIFTPDGDVDNDGKVDVADALRALRIAVGLIPPSEADARHGDVAPLSADGVPVPDHLVTAADALVILKKVVGLTSGW